MLHTDIRVRPRRERRGRTGAPRPVANFCLRWEHGAAVARCECRLWKGGETRLWIVLAVMASCWLTPVRAWSGQVPDFLVCGKPEVLDVVAAGLAMRGEMVEVERGSVGQVPGHQPDLLLCAVRVRVGRINTDRSGYQPLYDVVVHQYRVRAGRNGFFVSDANR